MSDVLDRLRKALADRYTVERELGRGGMATVYLAEDLKHKRQVAIYFDCGNCSVPDELRREYSDTPAW